MNQGRRFRLLTTISLLAAAIGGTAMAAEKGQEIILEASGPDAQEVLDHLIELIEKLPEMEDKSP